MKFDVNLSITATFVTTALLCRDVSNDIPFVSSFVPSIPRLKYHDSFTITTIPVRPIPGRKDDYLLTRLYAKSQNTSGAPRGVPTIIRWKRNRDKSITGFIYDSSSYDDGDKVTSSPLEEGSSVAGGSVVTTTSGSRYYLATPQEGRMKAMSLLSGAPTSPKIERKPATRPAAERKSITRRITERKPTASTTKQGPKKTISLQKPSAPVPFPRGFSSGPRGVPIIIKWKKNADKSVTGQIFNSNSFENGETVTTFPISSQTDVVGGVVVKTVSGARYYLAKVQNTNFKTLTLAETEESSRKEMVQRSLALAAATAPFGLFGISQNSILGDIPMKATSNIKDQTEKSRLQAIENERLIAIEKEKMEAAKKKQLEAEEKARVDMAEKERLEAEEKARVQAAIKKEQLEVEERSKKEAQEKARLETEEREKLEAALQEKLEAAEKEKLEAAEKEKLEAVEKEKLEAVEKEKLEAVEKEKLEAAEKEKLEAAEKETLEAAEKETLEAAEKEKLEAAEKDLVEAEEMELLESPIQEKVETTEMEGLQSEEKELEVLENELEVLENEFERVENEPLGEEEEKEKERERVGQIRAEELLTLIEKKPEEVISMDQEVNPLKYSIPVAAAVSFGLFTLIDKSINNGPRSSKLGTKKSLDPFGNFDSTNASDGDKRKSRKVNGARSPMIESLNTDGLSGPGGLLDNLTEPSTLSDGTLDSFAASSPNNYLDALTSQSTAVSSGASQSAEKKGPDAMANLPASKVEGKGSGNQGGYLNALANPPPSKVGDTGSESPGGYLDALASPPKSNSAEVISSGKSPGGYLDALANAPPSKVGNTGSGSPGGYLDALASPPKSASTEVISSGKSPGGYLDALANAPPSKVGNTGSGSPGGYLGELASSPKTALSETRADSSSDASSSGSNDSSGSSGGYLDALGKPPASSSIAEVKDGVAAGPGGYLDALAASPAQVSSQTGENYGVPGNYLNGLSKASSSSSTSKVRSTPSVAVSGAPVASTSPIALTLDAVDGSSSDDSSDRLVFSSIVEGGSENSDEGPDNYLDAITLSSSTISSESDPSLGTADGYLDVSTGSSINPSDTKSGDISPAQGTYLDGLSVSSISSSQSTETVNVLEELKPIMDLKETMDFFVDKITIQGQTVVGSKNGLNKLNRQPGDLALNESNESKPTELVISTAKLMAIKQEGENICINISLNV